MRQKGMEKLKSYMKEAGLSQADISRSLNISRSMVCYILAGERTPGLKLALHIERMTGGAVPVSVWHSA